LRKLPSVGEKIQDLQRKLWAKARAKPEFRFYALYDKVYRHDILEEAWRRVRENGGSPGLDGESIEAVEERGVRGFLNGLMEELRNGTYRPQAVKRTYIPKPDGRKRPLGIPCIRDRVVQQALLIVIEPIFEADFKDASWGYRPRRSAQQAAAEVVKYLNWGLTKVCDVDIKAYFDSIPHGKLMGMVARRIVDGKVLGLIKGWLECAVEEEGSRWKPNRGTPQGGVISPLLANIYLHAVDAAWESRGYRKRSGPNVQMVRYADDLVLLTNKDACWAMDRLRELLEELELELSGEKSRVVNAEKETFDFLGFTFRRVWNRERTKRAALYYPSKRSQKRLRERIRKVMHSTNPVSVAEQIERVNRILRGWVNYFRVSNASKVFHDVRWHVEMKLRRVLQRQQHRCGRGWKRYDYAYLYEKLGLWSDYRVRWQWR
jgi:group II intron reverse transcriptase/maturase